MNSNSPTKELIETIPLGNFMLYINGSSIWGVEDNLEKLSSKLNNIWRQSMHNTRIFACGILRYVGVTSDVKSEVSRWAEQLGENWKITSDQAVGQTFTWGDGEPETTYAVVLLSEVIALALLEESNEPVRTFIHELAHIHDNFRFIRTFGHSPIIVPGEWETIRQFLAHSTWAEFYAESTAFSDAAEDMISPYITYTVALLDKAISLIQNESISYKTHLNLGLVWATALEQLSGVFNQFGRTLGLIFSQTQLDDGHVKQLYLFFDEVTSLSKKWGEVASQLHHELIKLNEITQWQSEAFGILSNMVDNGFRACGLEPYVPN